MHYMTNIATALKSEISRIARKELRSETGALKKAVSSYRTEIAALKRRAQDLEQQVKKLSKAQLKVPTPPPEGDEKAARFSAKGLAAQRSRLGLSAEEAGLLIGTSSQSIYNWEQGQSRPRKSYMPALAALRKLGKKQAAAALEALQNKSET